MTVLSTFGLALALFALVISPGPGVFLTLSRTLNAGFSAALITILGIVLGDLTYVLLATFGLSLIAQTPAYISLLIEILLAGYLIGYGWHLWATANQNITPTYQNTSALRWRYFLEGLGMTLSNPKVILFYSGFLPNFVDLTKINALDLSIIVFTVTAVIGGVLTLYAFFALYLQRFLQSAGLVIWLNRLSASVIILAGLFILLRKLS